MIVGNLFQQAYTIVDSAIVGHYNGEAALAAVGASSALTTIFICVAIGGGIGASVIISQHFGAKRFARMKSAVYTALLTFLAVSVLLAGVGLLCSEQIMTALKTPPDALEIAVTYLNIYFYGLPFLFLYNILSSLFNALGKSRIPLYFLIFSSLLNVVLDWYFVAVLHRGVPGAAYATFLAQGLSAVLSFGVFLLELRRIPERSNGLFRFGELRAMTRVALPSILQQSTVSIGMMLVQSVVNGFGTQILAGFSAAARIESLCIVPMAAISNALSSYTAQNIGAEKPERVPQGYRAANRMIVLISVLLCVLLELFRTPIIAMFLDAAPSPETVATGEHYLFLLLHRLQNGCRRHPARRGRRENVHDRQPRQPGHPRVAVVALRAALGRRDRLVRRAGRLAGKLCHLLRTLPHRKVEGKTDRIKNPRHPAAGQRGFLYTFKAACRSVQHRWHIRLRWRPARRAER